MPLIHFGVTLDIFGLFEEAKTSQKVPKWIELVIYSTQGLKVVYPGQELNLPVFGPDSQFLCSNPDLR